MGLMQNYYIICSIIQYYFNDLIFQIEFLSEARSVAPRKARYLAFLRSQTNRC